MCFSSLNSSKLHGLSSTLSDVEPVKIVKLVYKSKPYQCSLSTPEPFRYLEEDYQLPSYQSLTVNLSPR